MKTKWKYIYDTLKQDIIQLKENDKMDSERILSERFQVNRLTVRKALNKLIEDKYLIRFEKKGTFITKYKPYQSKSNLDLIDKSNKISTDFKFTNHPLLDNSLHFTSRHIDNNSKLQSVEEVFISREFLPARWEEKYEKIVQENYITFIEVHEYTSITKINKVFSTFEANDKNYILLKSDIINDKNEIIAISTSIFPIKDFNFSFTQYR